MNACRPRMRPRSSLRTTGLSDTAFNRLRHFIIFLFSGMDVVVSMSVPIGAPATVPGGASFGDASLRTPPGADAKLRHNPTRGAHEDFLEIVRVFAKMHHGQSLRKQVG